MSGAITARRLLHWGDLDVGRRRRATRLGRWRWPALIAIGGGLAAAVVAEARTDPALASRLALAVMVAAYGAVMMATSFRMYWRTDSPLLARLPIPGDALFDVALIRSLRAAGIAAVIAVPPSAAMATVSVELALRHGAILAAVALASALLLPAVALGAGALVAGGKADSLVRAVGGGEVTAPPSAWLGILPGLAAAAVVLAVIGAGPWASGGAASTVVGTPAALLGGLAGVAVLAALAARQAAPKVMPQAVREVAALDVQRLAHLEIHPPTGLERAVMGRLGAGALIFGKDARLLRRRFPMAFVTGATTTLALWGVAAARPDAAWLWVATIMAGFATYAMIMAHRLVARPIELPYVATLPVAPSRVLGAKTAYLAVWTLLYPAVGAVPVAVWIGPVSAAIVGGAAVVALVVGSRLIRL